MKKYLFTCVICCLVSLSSVSAESGATFSLSYDAKQLTAEGQTKVSIYVLPNDDAINALEGDIVLSKGSGQISAIEDGNSIVSAWVERPSVVDNSIRFAGIIPGGFNGIYSPFEEAKLPGLVFQFTLRATTPGTVSVSLNNLKAYKGAGEDSLVRLDPDLLTVPFIQASGLSTGQSSDIVAPSDLTAEVVKLGNETDGWFAVFSARDNGSGIDYFEYQESLTENPSDDQWERVESPVRLKDQTRRHYVIIKAVDRNGNSTLLAVAPQKATIPEFIYGAFALALILLLVILKFLRVRV